MPLIIARVRNGDITGIFGDFQPLNRVLPVPMHFLGQAGEFQLLVPELTTPHSFLFLLDESVIQFGRSLRRLLMRWRGQRRFVIADFLGFLGVVLRGRLKYLLIRFALLTYGSLCVEDQGIVNDMTFIGTILCIVAFGNKPIPL